ncbi:hypothetical protein FN846DRAFT_891180 [Sphaerosporella brunnea]|uniref:Uncharacterized protein n=1 Tax=Sphaerosporella brunnea TaxID=1250544 RepID=A0A5J5EU99_9PEZI|nr:hypothetical protein FN846DRAFT_891180 [Sphaerosporella brunnea]
MPVEVDGGGGRLGSTEARLAAENCGFVFPAVLLRGQEVYHEGLLHLASNLTAMATKTKSDKARKTGKGRKGNRRRMLNRAAQTGVFDLDIRIFNRLFIDVSREGGKGSALSEYPEFCHYIVCFSRKNAYTPTCITLIISLYMNLEESVVVHGKHKRAMRMNHLQST